MDRPEADRPQPKKYSYIHGWFKIESGATSSAFVACKNCKKIKTLSVPLRKCKAFFKRTTDHIKSGRMRQ